MKQPLISVLMPVFNTENYIAQAIESVLHQTYSNWELIIVDDHSSDKTWSVIQKYQDKRIRAYRNHLQLGLAGNRNRTLSLARGSYLAVLDADDSSESTRFEKQLQVFTDNDSLVLCGTWATVVDSYDQVIGQWRFPSTPDAVRAQFYLQFPVVHSSAMIKAAAIKKLRLTYDSAFAPAEDYDFCFKLLSLGEVVIVPEYLTRYRLHNQSTSQKYHDVVTHKLPKIYAREYQKLGIQGSLTQCTDLSHFLNPRTSQTSNFSTVFKLLWQLQSKLVTQHHLSQLTLVWWYWYLGKTFLLQLRNYFLGLINQKQPQP